MDAGDSLSIGCRILRGLPKPQLTWTRVDEAPINFKEQAYDGKDSILVIEFDRNDIKSYDATFKCNAKNKFQTISEQIFAGPGRSSVHI